MHKYLQEDYTIYMYLVSSTLFVKGQNLGMLSYYRQGLSFIAFKGVNSKK